MVALSNALKNSEEILDTDYSFLPEPLKYTSVSLSDIFENNFRFEAGAFNLDAKQAINTIKNNPFGYLNLWSSSGLVKNAYYPGRFKRIYVSKKDGVPFFLPSQLTEVNAKPTKFISPKTYKTLKGVEIEPNQLLLTRSGTIGKCSISSRSNIGKLYSDDIIRVNFVSEYDLGYVYAFFQTSEGQLILQSTKYGAVVKHIEPEHLQGVILPNAPSSVKKEIHDLIMESFRLRDDSNDLLVKAEHLLLSELNLTPMDDLKSEEQNEGPVRIFETKLSNLNSRFDSSYHIPLYLKIEIELRKSHKVFYLRDKSISKNIVLPGRFKRTYVASERTGIKFIGGKQIRDLNPDSEKFLSNSIHKTRLGKELLLQQNSILITRSGTIGKIALVPEHWNNWAGNEHIIRLYPSSEDLSGYIFCWLNSDYGIELLKKHTYGAVVDEIDDKHVGDVLIPVLGDREKQSNINSLVLKANELRYEAFLKEQQAVSILKQLITEKQGL